MAGNPQSATNFPLRWESTGDKWWYASPIDCAAANGHYDLVLELLRLDPNLLISLTSLRRLRRLESLWSSSAAASRSAVARRLLRESKIPPSSRAWALYTAASAGDLDFVRELLAGDPLVVFGEGEYGVTDMLYAAARGGSTEVFWEVYGFVAAPRFEGAAEGAGEVPPGFKWEVVNRAAHAAARGGNSVVLAELLGGGGGGGGDGVLGYRDAYGSTVLHAAAGKGQVEVVEYLVATYGNDIISATDNEGNTALHVAAYKGQLSVVEALLSASPSSITATNKAGNTLLHLAVAGALSPGFQRLDCQIELTKQLIMTRNKFNVEDIINAKNNEGQTVLHMATIGNVHSDLVELLMAARYINVNVRDDHGMTPLDYLRHQPRSSSSEMLIRQLISAGGMSNCQDYSARKAFALHLRTQGAICSSPGTSFRVLDSEIFKYSGMEIMLSGSKTHHRGVTIPLVSAPSEISHCGSNGGEEERVASENKKRGGPVENAAKRFKTMFHWPKTKKKRMSSNDNDDEVESRKTRGSVNETPIPLRERFSGPTSLSNNKRTLAVRSNTSSPINRKKFASGVVQGVMADQPHGNTLRMGSSSTSLSKSSISSHSSLYKGKGADDVAGSSFSVQDEADETPRLMHKQGPKAKLMNQYLCFGGSRLSVKNSIGRRHRHPSTGNKQSMQTVACH